MPSSGVQLCRCLLVQTCCCYRLGAFGEICCLLGCSVWLLVVGPGRMCTEGLLCSFADALHCFASYPVAAPAAWYTLQFLLRGVYFAFLLFTLPPCCEQLFNVECLPCICAFFLMHGGCPPASITQSGLTTGKSVHGKPQSKAKRSIYNK